MKELKDTKGIYILYMIYISAKEYLGNLETIKEQNVFSISS
jgi:hypothetical protein